MHGGHCVTGDCTWVRNILGLHSNHSTSFWAQNTFSKYAPYSQYLGPAVLWGIQRSQLAVFMVSCSVRDRAWGLTCARHMCPPPHSRALGTAQEQLSWLGSRSSFSRESFELLGLWTWIWDGRVERPYSLQGWHSHEAESVLRLAVQGTHQNTSHS